MLQHSWSMLLPALLVLALPGCRSGLPRQEGTFDGLKREFYVIEPSAPARALVFALHGGSGTAPHVLTLAPDLRALAEKHGVVLVLPQGIGKSWNDGRLDPISTAHKERLPDSEFLTALARDLKQKFNIPADRVFTMGISNGGMMSLRLVCDSDVFSGAVIIAAQMQIDYAEKCSAAQQPRVLFIVGTKDPLVPYDGGPVSVLGRKRGVVYSADRSAAYWRNKNRCNAAVLEKALPDTVKTDETTARMQTWNCPSGSVGLVHVEGGGHTWPGGDQYLPARFVGTTSRDFSASEMAFQWFGIEK